MSTAKSVGIIINPRLKDALRVAELSAAWLETEGHRVRVARTAVPGAVEAPISLDFVPLRDVVEESDLLVVLGGDGTLLGVARAPGADRVPILAVNLGTVGFLTEVTRDELRRSLTSVLEGRYETDERMMLGYSLAVEDEPKVTGYALNDIAIRDSSHLICLDVFINEEYAVSIRGDGVIVATPTGSTAYSCSAGGPIVHPASETLLITPICSFALAMRPFVVPSATQIRIVVRSETPNGVLRADGQEQYPLTQGCHIRAWRAPKTISLIRSQERDFYAALRAKLHLGNLPSG